MAEGGYDPDETGTLPGGEGETDEKGPLFPHQGDEMGMKGRQPPPGLMVGPPQTTKTSTSQQHKADTSFITDTPSGKIHTSRAEQEFAERQAMKEELDKEVLYVYPEIKKFRLAQISRNEYGQIVLNEGRKNSIPHVIIDVNGEASEWVHKAAFPKGIRRDLGRTNEQINRENYEKQLKEEEKQAEREKKLEKVREMKAENEEKLSYAQERLDNLNKVLREKLDSKNRVETPEEAEDIDRSITTTRKSIKTVGIEVDGYTKERGRLERETIDAEAKVVEGERSVETARERVNERLLSLRDRVKEIFKKHGFTIASVLSAIGVVIGVIVSNLKAGLTKVAKGVGNGLKELGKKLGEILPGMIGAIASFIFRTAGEVIGFLAKNAWLLVVGLVVLAVEQLKKKSK